MTIVPTQSPHPIAPASVHPTSPLKRTCVLTTLALALFTTTPAAMASNQAAKQPAPPRAPLVSYADRPDAMEFAATLAAQHGLEADWVREWLSEARQHPDVIRLMTPAPVGTPKDWNAYRARFIEPKRIAAGVSFWRKNRQWLSKAQAEYGVPAWLIVGIIGVETLYGEHTGKFRVLDALSTLAFDFPDSHPRKTERSAYFRTELGKLLQYSKQHGIKPNAWLGSYAGAVGLPQFMPGSLMRFGVDFDGNGRTDLLGSPADAIGSVANYLKAFGWQTGMPTHYALNFDREKLDLDALMAPDILPTFTPAAMESKGVRLEQAATGHGGLLALVELQNGDPQQNGKPPIYVAGTENFYAITRYNWSSYYAMAVIELGRSVEAALNP